MTTTQDIRVGEFVVPTLTGGVLAEDNGSERARSGTGHLEVLAISGRGEQKKYTLIGLDGQHHQYPAMFFRRRPD